MTSLLSILRILLLAGLFMAASCGGATKTTTPPNVLLVVVDTLRADHLATYGYGRPVPGIDALARDGVTVDGLRACTSWTMPSMATLFTGLAPREHRVMRMRGLGSNLLETRTLAAEFQTAGYATGCVMANFLLLKGRGFDVGYDVYDDAPARRQDPHRGSTAAEVADRGLAWLKEVDAEQPWFLTLHFFDPHTSYEDHLEFSFTDPNYEGWVRGGLPDAVYKANQATTTAADRAQLRALYDEEVHAVGTALERVLAALEERGEAGDTLVVFTADHGEELAERGYIGHTRTLHFEQVNLPLIVRFPDGRGAGSRRAGMMPQDQLYATVLEMAGLAIPEGRGASRAAWLEGDTEEAGSPPLVRYEVDFEPVVPDPARRIQKRAVEKRDAQGKLLGKLVHDLKAGTQALYVDDAEAVDRIADPAHTALLEELRAELARPVWYTP